jgi:hypothetical protein
LVVVVVGEPIHVEREASVGREALDQDPRARFQSCRVWIVQRLSGEAVGPGCQHVVARDPR